MAKTVIILHGQKPLPLSRACLALTTRAAAVLRRSPARARLAEETRSEQEKNSPESYSRVVREETTDGCRGVS